MIRHHSEIHDRTIRRSGAPLAILLAVVVLGVAAFRVTPAAEPLRLEAQVGVCEHGLAKKGIWWNDAYPTAIDLRDTCSQLGLSRVGESRNCIGRGVISQRTWGFSAGGFAERPFGPVRLGAEAGAFVYYSSFHVVVTYRPSGALRQDSLWADWNATPFLGLTASAGTLFIVARWYGSVKAHERGCGGCDGITSGGAWQATVGIQGRFK